MKVTRKSKYAIELLLDDPLLEAEEFRSAVNAFIGIIRNVAEDIAKQKEAVKWRISAREGSTIIVARAEPHKIKAALVPKIVNSIQQGVKSLERSDSRPLYFSDTSLRHVRDLAMITNVKDGESKQVKFGDAKKPTSVSAHAIANVNSILGSARKEKGSVEGRVSMLVDRGRLEVTVDDILTGYAIKCNASADKEPELIAAFKKRVFVTGDVHYRRDGAPISIDVEAIRILGKGKVPSFDDVLGIMRR